MRAQWLKSFTDEHPPMREGFLLALLAQPPQSVVTSYGTSRSTEINPCELAELIMEGRAEMAGAGLASLAERMPAFNVELQRRYLESSSYTSGSHASPLGRRGSPGHGKPTSR